MTNDPKLRREAEAGAALAVGEGHAVAGWYQKFGRHVCFQRTESIRSKKSFFRESYTRWAMAERAIAKSGFQSINRQLRFCL